MDYLGFISKLKSILIAPAGYGKTYTIAKCLEITQGKQLILTHTNAGVAALREKIKALGIQPSKFHVETIMSYAQKYVNAFYVGKDIPEQDNSASYWPFILQKATALVRIKPIADVIKATYNGLFVDEYQDCTISQHRFIAELSVNFPSRILGDPLQGIFDFNNEPLVDFDKDLNDYLVNRFELSEPQRWMRGNNAPLGDSLRDIREKLLKNEALDLGVYSTTIERVDVSAGNLYAPRDNYNRKIWSLLGEGNVLLIYPDSKNMGARQKIVRTFKNAIVLVEAVDSSDFYSISKRFDNSPPAEIEKTLRDVSYNLFNTDPLNNWFNENGLKNKKGEAERLAIEPIKRNIDALRTKINFPLIASTLKQIKSLVNDLCFRRELFLDLCRALEQADDKLPVLESMKGIRNQRRVIGRKIYGKCIGTTLLTKGLEFDTVAVLDADKIDCPKNLYVALTRASKRLVVFSSNNVLSPYKVNNNGD
jgi:DNA helicase-2/ATP-dependent DNA helicase PcrA